MSEHDQNTSSNDEAGDPCARARYPKRFYKTVSVLADGCQFAPMLDDRPIKTPKRNAVSVPTKEFADAIAAEWTSQGEIIDPTSMPLTRLVNSILDGVIGNEDAVADEIARYVTSDLLCYRAEHPEELIKRQSDAWDPVLDWAKSEFDLTLNVATGLMPVAQPEGIAEKLRTVLPSDAFPLAALHIVTTMTGSALLALAVARGRLGPEKAWQAAHVDEDWQISQWGEDAEATARRALRWREFDAAGRVLEYLR